MKYLLSILCLLSFCFAGFRLGFDISSNINVKQDELIMPLSLPSLKLEKPKSTKNLIIGYDKYSKIPLGIGIESCISERTIYLGLPSEFKTQRAANWSGYIFYYTPTYKSIQGFIRYGVSTISNYSDEFSNNILDNGMIMHDMGSQAGQMYAFGISINKFQIAYSNYTNSIFVYIDENGDYSGGVSPHLDFEIEKLQISFLIK